MHSVPIVPVTVGKKVAKCGTLLMTLYQKSYMVGLITLYQIKSCRVGNPLPAAQWATVCLSTNTCTQTFGPS